MRQGSDLNHVQLHGRVEEPPVLSHRNHGLEFYRFPLLVRRLSGTGDYFSVDFFLSMIYHMNR